MTHPPANYWPRDPKHCRLSYNGRHYFRPGGWWERFWRWTWSLLWPSHEMGLRCFHCGRWFQRAEVEALP